jgi:hypothetical protein
MVLGAGRHLVHHKIFLHTEDSPLYLLPLTASYDQDQCRQPSMQKICMIKLNIIVAILIKLFDGLESSLMKNSGKKPTKKTSTLK